MPAPSISSMPHSEGPEAEMAVPSGSGSPVFAARSRCPRGPATSSQFTERLSASERIRTLTTCVSVLSSL